MNSPAVLIIAGQDDLHALAVAQLLQDQFECEPMVLDMAQFPLGLHGSFEYDTKKKLASADFANFDLGYVGAGWWRRPGRCSVPNDFFAFDVDFLQTECDHFLQGLLWSTRFKWVNHPTSEVFASRKVVQLKEAISVGLNVPKTIITNVPERARSFVKKFGKAVITKRIGTSAGVATKTALVGEDDFNRLHTVQTCPTMLQEYIEPGGDVRVVVIGQEIFAFWIDSASGSSRVDCRVDLTVAHRSHTLPEKESDLIRKLLAKLKLDMGVVDLRVSRTGEHYFLEINPSGQYLYLELLANIPLSMHVASYLAGIARLCT